VDDALARTGAARGQRWRVAHRPRLRPHAHRLPPWSDQKTQSKGNALAHCATSGERHAVTNCGKNSAVIYEGSWQLTGGVGVPIKKT
jgi:hypothetical protein